MNRNKIKKKKIEKNGKQNESDKQNDEYTNITLQAMGSDSVQNNWRGTEFVD